MVRKLAALMTDQELRLLSRLNGPVYFGSYAIAPAAGSDFWLVEPKHAPPLMLRGDYQDVEFKFECLYIRLDEPTETFTRRKGSLLDHAEVDVRDVKLLVRASWIRKAMPNEVPPNWEQMVERRGKLESVPGHALAAYVAVVGLLLTDVAGIKTLLRLSDGPPTSIERITDIDRMTEALKEGELVAPSDFAALRVRLQGWELSRSPPSS